MSQDDRQQEDVAGLFRKFGGDATRYKEFAPAESPRAPGAWPLVNGTRGAVETATAPAPVPAQVSVVPPPAPTAPVALAPMPMPAAAPVADTAAAAPRELDALFARLAGATPPTAVAGQGLMSHWRRSG